MAACWIFAIMMVPAGLWQDNYGSLLSLFPTTTYDYFGTNNGGVNYGLVFTAWGVGGVFGGALGGYVADITGGYTFAYQIVAGLLFIAAIITFVTRIPKRICVSEPLALTVQ